MPLLASQRCEAFIPATVISVSPSCLPGLGTSKSNKHRWEREGGRAGRELALDYMHLRRQHMKTDTGSRIMNLHKFRIGRNLRLSGQKLCPTQQSLQQPNRVRAVDSCHPLRGAHPMRGQAWLVQSSSNPQEIFERNKGSSAWPEKRYHQNSHLSYTPRNSQLEMWWEKHSMHSGQPRL